MSPVGCSLRIWGILSICLFSQGCDQVPGMLGQARASLDPIVGEWREVADSDTSDITKLAFKPNRRVVLTTFIRNPRLTEIERSFARLLDSIPATFARGDSVVVISYDRRALDGKWREMSAKFGEEGPVGGDNPDIDSVGTLDETFKYKLNGDILELTEERGHEYDLHLYPAKLRRFVRVQ